MSCWSISSATTWAASREYGSVHVKDFMVIEYYSHVMHIVSEVVGELAEGKDAYDVIAATFPGGTITGAPKIRTHGNH